MKEILKITLVILALLFEAFASSPSTETIVSASWDTTIKIWNSKSFELIKTVTGHTDEVYALAILPSTKNIVNTMKRFDH